MSAGEACDLIAPAALAICLLIVAASQFAC